MRKREYAQRREETRAVLAQAQPEPGASPDDIRARVVQALHDRDLTWTPSQIDATVDTLAGSLGHPALIIPRVLGRIALRRWKQRRDARGAGSATDADPPSE